MLTSCASDDLWMYALENDSFKVEKIAKQDTGIGAAYGTAKSGIGIAGVGTYRPDLIMKVVLPSDLSFV